MEREWVVEESVAIEASASDVYAAVADPRRMREWSPEVFAAWVRGRTIAPGTRFVGFNRIGWRVWFTTCQVTAAVPGEAFAFRVSSFGVPVALWGYRIEEIAGQDDTGQDGASQDDAGQDGAGQDGAEGGSGPRTRLTEYWEDQRRDNRGAAFVSLLGRLFTGVPAGRRAAVNRDGMRATLDRIRTATEKG
ncbi:SRPBCC family protein [Actinomadura sp. 7K507]|uniref:SRPBCC family protein n=1 Tax=Actinomadura sp. 7K507 TaxID=2530365 RepID=UPI00105216C8|nr:SRPBCC family protein [Actinomadura sp. 7K507]TDC83663.1 SRPBCC family protein [Actinomadura sp. 7K507]